MVPFRIKDVTREAFAGWLRDPKSPKRFVPQSACKCPVAEFVNTMQPKGRCARVTRGKIRIVAREVNEQEISDEPLYSKEYNTPGWAAAFIQAFDGYSLKKYDTMAKITLTSKRALLILESLP